MRNNAVTLSPIGMNKDNGPLIHNPLLAFDIKNMRVVSNGDNTSFSLLSEQGNTEIVTVNDFGTQFEILGNTLGKAVINDYLVLFTHQEQYTDRIYSLIKVSDLIIATLLFEGDLGFNADKPIETNSVYENENILKVYWVDGINQPRMINIVGTIHITNTNQFDFVPKLNYNETVTITRLFKGGVFPSGTIQYALTYFNRNGLESNIFHISPIYNLTHSNRGASPEENTSNSFKIDVTTPDVLFEYMRIYSVVKTSLASVPIIKKVQDISVRETSSHIVDLYSVDAGLAATYAANETLYIEGSFNLNIERYYEVDINGNPVLDSNGDPVWITNGQTISITSGWIKYTAPISTTLTHVDTGGVLTSISIINNNSLGESFTIEYFDGIHRVTETLVYQQITIDNISGTLEFGKYGSNIIDAEPTHIVFIDTNITGEIVSPTHLLYLGGTPVLAETLCVKDNTMFLGNITLNTPIAGNVELGNGRGALREYIRNAHTVTDVEKVLGKDESLNNYYGYKPESLINENYTTFKNRDVYRLGLLLQHENGVWSEPIFIEDHTVAKELTTAQNDNRKGCSIRIDLLDINTITSSLLKHSLLDAGFKRYRPVVVYPSIYERSVIAQGVINPTLFNVEDRYQNAPTNISSWYFRPMTSANYLGLGLGRAMASTTGAPVEFRHNRFLVPASDCNGEILVCNDTKRDVYLIDTTPTASEDFVQYYKENFAVDLNLVTFHSPDIEFDESLSNLDKTNLKFRIIGLAHFTGFKNNIDITTETAQFNSTATGFTNRNCGQVNYSTIGTNTISSLPCWNDKPEHNENWRNFVVYTWLGNKSLSGSDVLDDSRYGILSLKKIANLRYSGFNTYVTPVVLNITPVEIFNSDVNSLIRIEPPTNSGLSYITYQGNVDKIISPNIQPNKESGPPIYATGSDPTTEATSLTNWKNAYTAVPNHFVKEPANIKFKSSPHGVFAFDWSSTNQLIITPSINSLNILENIDVTGTPFWKSVPDKCLLNSITVSTVPAKAGGLWIGELYREINNDFVDTIFGGNTKSAIEANQWIPAGEAKDIDDTATDLVLDYMYGDTYFLRYDCLKTYPLNIEDEETLVEIGSFLLETRVNIDGRYDKNRGSIDNLNTLPSNFNLINTVYTKPLNYFTYRGLNYDLFKIDEFKNTITWTGTKVNSEDIDTFTNVTLNNVLDLNGAMGTIRSLMLFNDSIIGFLDKGVFSVLYNNRISISTSDGVPIEMASSGKVEGYKYITSFSGTSNKHSIVSTENGIYYVDYLNKSINVLTGKGIESLSDKLGFSSWIKNQLDSNGDYDWTPTNMNNFKIDYDSIKKDVYINNTDYSLAFSEKVGLFTSFYGYNNIPYMFNVWKDFIAVLNLNDKTVLWKQQTGNLYNTFFGLSDIVYVDYMVNPLPGIPKQFDAVEFYSDKWSNNSLLNIFGFENQTITDEYLVAYSEFTNPYEGGETIKRKSRLWRSLLPRLTGTMRRFVNPYIKYKITSLSTDRIVLNNTNIYFNY